MKKGAKILCLIATLLLVIIVFFVLQLSGGSDSQTFIEEPAPHSRVEAMTGMIQRHIAELPSPLLDANYIEYQKGSGALGPSDFKFYARIKIKPTDVSHWIQDLKEPYNSTTFYSEPRDTLDWWLSMETFQTLKLYETKSYFGRYNGWIAVDDSNGYFYVFTFTQ